MKKKTPPPPAAAAHIGLDLAKDKFDAVLFTPAGIEHHKVFPNTAEGLKTLGRWLTEHRISRTTAVMEATGIYWEEVAAWLHARHHTVHVINPAQARRFAESQICRQKTDAVDAAMLCRMARISGQCGFQPWTPPAAERLALRQLTRGRESLVGHRAALQQQALECRDKTVSRALRAAARTLTTQITALEAAIARHLEAHPALAGDARLLESIPGIGAVSAAVILAELTPVAGAGVEQCIAYAGLHPRQWQSGSSLRAQSKLSKTGNARLRRACYLPALCGWRFNPLLRAFAARLLAGGKKKMQVLAALMHKLLALACGVLKTRQPFDANWLSRHNNTSSTPSPTTA
jgi:transposase